MDLDPQIPPYLLNRRQLLTAGGAGVLALALAACGSTSAKPSTSPTTGATTGGETGVSTSKLATTLTVAIAGDPNSIDPIAYNSPPNVEVYWLVNEQLLQYGPGQAFQPLLASAMPTVSADGLTFTVKLLSGVTFTNGKAFDSSDVKYTYEQIIAPANASAWQTFLAQIKSIETPDPQTVVFQLSSIDTYFLDSLASIPIIPSNIPYTKTAYASTLVGTGPYKLDSWDHNQQLTFSANPTFRTKGVPATPKLIYKIIPTESAQLASLAEGSIDIVPGLSAQGASTLKSRGLKVYQEQGGYGVIWLWPSFVPGSVTANLNLRLAMAWAIDRAQIVQQVFYGYGAPLSTLPGTGSTFYNPKLGQFFGSSPNLALARSYLAKAGGPPKAPINVTVDSTEATTLAAVTIVQANLKQIGIDLAIQAVDPATADNIRSSHKFEIYAQSSAILIPASQGYLLYAKGSAFNFNLMDDAELNSLALNVEAYNRSDPRAAAAVTAVQQRVTEVVPLIALCTFDNLFGMRPGVQNFEVYNVADYIELAHTSASA
jgi:peptide/nickel transport system substrate-binding protein